MNALVTNLKQLSKSSASSNSSRWVLWGAYALLLAAVPMLFTSSLSMTMLSQVGFLVIICLSYNILLGQGGMLSFGHAVYSGLGAFMAIHAMNLTANGTLYIPLPFIPLVGGLAGLLFAVLFGYVTTKKAGTTFAMITLGVGELVFAMSLMFPEFFGGEGGITTNRTYGTSFFGISFGPQIQVYYLIAIYCFICTAVMFAFTRTPLGRILNAVRDNPERVEFIGYDTQRVRYYAFIVAGFFAGIGGGLAAINSEIVTAEVVSGLRSGSFLLFTFLGGATFFFGPIIGAGLLVLALIWLSELTAAWLLYVGLIFMFMVMFAPGGVASLIMMNLRLVQFGRLKELAWLYLGLSVTAVIGLFGAAAAIEMLYHLQLKAALGAELDFLGMKLNTLSLSTWIYSSLLILIGFSLFELLRRRFALQWGVIQNDIEIQIKQRESS
jgi:branched-chain amino acid transport system permease protein